MNFWVITVVWNGQERPPLKTLYASPFQAETAAERHRRNTAAGYRYGVRPATWQEREAAMFEAKLYQPPVWHEEMFWQLHGHKLLNHYVHISMADPQSIAFTEDERKGEADRQTLMRPGKYLQKFMGAGPDGLIEYGPMKGECAVVNKQKIAFYAAWHKVGHRPPTDDELHFTDHPDEMIRVYEDGPDSCMMGKGWREKDHPVQIYAGGGLSLAYLTKKGDEGDHDDGAVIGRALCWPEKAVFGRVYPTPHTESLRNTYDELMARLKAKGWTSIEEDGSVFEGALLRKITNAYGTYIMPYLDHGYGVEGVYRNGENWWKMTLSEPHQENTDGTYCEPEDEIDWYCDHCEDGYSNDHDSCTVYRRWASQPRTGRPGYGFASGDMYWCENCRDNNAFYCEGSDEYYTYSADSVEVGYERYEMHWFLANGGYQCVYSDDYYFHADDPGTQLANGAWINNDNLADGAFQCLWDGQWWPKDFESQTCPGYAVNCDMADIHPVEFEHDVPHIPEDADEGMAVQAMLTHANDDTPVVIDLAKSGLSYDPACIRSAA